MDDMLKSLGALAGLVLARNTMKPRYECIRCHRFYEHAEARKMTYICDANRCYGYLINTDRL